jgi:C_GCAxxG_C_C family probable redox protein
LQDKLHVGSKDVFKAGSALAGGIARRGETCGALTGAILAVSSLVGREALEDREQLQKSLEEADRVYSRFKRQIGGTLCSEIHSIRYGKVYHLFIPQERQAFHEMGGHSRKGCPEICGAAAKIAAEVILGIRERQSY